MLAIAPSEEVIALPKGLRQLTQLYPPNLLAQVPMDIGRIHGEKIHLIHPDLSFIAPYSHPPSLEVLRNQHIALFSIQSINTVKEIQETLLKVGHASNHILEAQLLAIFMEATFLSIDNRLQALQKKKERSDQLKKFLYLSHRKYYAQPTTKCLTGQLMARALKQCSHLQGEVPESLNEWKIPCDQEKIVEFSPEVMIISTYPQRGEHNSLAFQETHAFQSNQIFYVDEIVQDSPTQYIALAYFDLFQALTGSYSL